MSASNLPPALRGGVIRQQDLTTLPVLRALLRERSVTRAGELVGLSQPATSAVLARLRRRFGDELLVRRGREFELTPLASSILERLDLAVEALERIFEDDFDPQNSVREFTLTVSDYTSVMLGEALNSILKVEAPNVRLQLRRISSSLSPGLESVIRQCDGIVLPSEFTHDYPSVPLLRDRWVCIVAADNSLVGDRLEEGDLARLSWVGQYARAEQLAMPALRQLRSYGILPHVDVFVEGFGEVPFLVAGSERIAFLHERLARRLQGVVPIRILEPPIKLAELGVSLFWHPAIGDDPAHEWMRRTLQQAAVRAQE